MDSENSYIDKQIGNYRVVDELGGGGFGNVYRAQHIFLAKRIVAIKLLNASRLNSQEERESFLQEAQVLEMLKHPNILPFIDFGINEGFPYLVTEYAAHGSLRVRIKRHAPLPMEEALSIILQTGQALHYAHQQNIIHRDLKPENILFNAKGVYHLGRYREALNTLERAILLAPNDMSLYYGKGLVSEHMQHYQDALQAYEQATRLDPGYAPAWRKKGDVLRILNRRQEALAAYERAMHLDPDDTAAYKSRQELLGK